MKPLALLALPLFALVLGACGPKVSTKILRAAAPLPDYAPVVVFEIGDTSVPKNAEILAEIHVGDKGMTLDCGYPEMLQRAKERARAVGANALQIYQHKYPDMFSSCHRLRVRALRLADITPFEKEIVWNKNRRLRQVDFKGTTSNRPFVAATVSSFRGRYQGKPFQPQVLAKVEAFFDCEASYFKANADSVEVLRHEQVHFDITEVFARKYLKTLQNEVKSRSELSAKVTELSTRIGHEMQLLNDEYDTASRSDRNYLTAWESKIALELEALKAFERHEVVLELGKKN